MHALILETEDFLSCPLKSCRTAAGVGKPGDTALCGAFRPATRRLFANLSSSANPRSFG